MKNLSPLQIRNRINNFGYSVVKRKLTELEKQRVFNMEQILIQKSKYNEFLKDQIINKFGKLYSVMTHKEKGKCRRFILELKTKYPKSEIN